MKKIKALEDLIRVVELEEQQGGEISASFLLGLKVALNKIKNVK